MGKQYEEVIMKTAKVLADGGYEFHRGDVIGEDKWIVGSVTEKGVCLKYNPRPEVLSLILDLHYFCEQKNLTHEVFNLEQTRDELAEEINNKKRLIERLNARMGL